MREWWRNGNHRATVVLLMGLVGGLLAGCGGGDSPTAPPGGGDGDDSGGGELAAATIGPGGGTLATPDSTVVVVFAADAVAEETRFTLDAADGLPGDPGYVPGTGVVLGPSDVTFTDRVTMSLRYDAADLPAGLINGSLALCALVDGHWEPVVGKAVAVEGEIPGTGTFGAVGSVLTGDVYEGTCEVYDQATLEAAQAYAGITGDLRIGGDDLPETVEMPALQWVGGSLVIEDAPSDTVRFPALRQVDWALEVVNCPHHIELLLPVCQAVGSLIIDESDLRHLDGLSALRRLNPLGLDFLGGIAFEFVDALQSLAPLSGLSGTASGIRIYGAPALTSLAGLGGFSRVRDVEIAHTTALTSLDGLHLVSVERRLLIWFNSRLASLAALETLGEVGEIVIQANGELENLQGLGNIGTIYKLSIVGNPALTTLSGLAPIASLQSSLFIEDNDVLEDLAGLGHLQSIGGNLRIAENPALEHLDELANLVHVEDCLEIEANEHLQDLDGLSSLIHAWGAIRINHNLRLADVSGLDGLQANPATGYVCGSFTATYNCLHHGACVGNAAFWDIIEAFGGEEMVQYAVTIHNND